MKFLLIGNGFIAPRHKEAIKIIGGEIRGIVDVDRGENKWKETIRETDADCVVILTPNDLHYEMIKLASDCKKTVLCEKPMAIKSEHLKSLATKPNVFSVLQLRYHPDVKKIKSRIEKDKKNEIEMDISVFRDEDYYSGWKGKRERSGGILFNLGVHYFDLFLYLFGDARKAELENLDERTGTGVIEGDNYFCRFRVSTGAKRENQRRVFKINGEQYNFSSKDNLSFENLHQFVYRDLLEGKGIGPKEALRSVELIEKLYQSYEK